MSEVTYNNYHLAFEPTRTDEIWGQPYIVSLVNGWVKKGDHPSFITFVGGSGVGKTATAKVLINTTHCLNRGYGQIYPCGECAICKSDPSTGDYNRNVIWLKAGSGQETDSVQKQIKDALLTAEQGPVQSGNLEDAHREILFIVLEEMQNIPTNLIQKAFAFADVESRLRGKVCFIGITMSPEKFSPELKKALTHRGCVCEFRKPSNTELEEYLKTYYEGIPEESAKIIASRAENSYRGALSYAYTCFKVLNTNKTAKLTPENVSNILQLAPKSARYKLWEMLEDIQFVKNKDIATYINNLLPYTIPTEFAKQLLDDIVDSLENNYISLDDYKFAVKHLYLYILNPGLFPLSTILYNLRGLKLVRY